MILCKFAKALPEFNKTGLPVTCSLFIQRFNMILEHCNWNLLLTGAPALHTDANHGNKLLLWQNAKVNVLMVMESPLLEKSIESAPRGS